MKTFSVRYALCLPTGGLVIVHHNEICDKIIHITKQAFSLKCLYEKNLIHLGHSRYEEEVNNGGIIPETQGDVSIWGLWESQKESIIDVRFKMLTQRLEIQL